MTVWPFCPRDGMVESLIFKTDAIRAFSTEQRLMLAEVPRRTFNHAYTLTAPQYERARSLMRANHPGPFEVPDWAQRLAVSAYAGDSAVNVDTTSIGFEVGGRVILWRRWDDFETLTVEEIAPGVLTFEDAVSGDYSRALIMPLVECDAAEGLKAVRTIEPAVNAEIEWRSYEGPDLSQGDENTPTHRDHPVLTHCAKLGSASYQETVMRLYDSVDNGLARPYVDTSVSQPAQTWGSAWQPISLTDQYSLRKFFYYLRGRKRAFWAPIWNKRGITLAQPIGASDTALIVQYVGLSEAYSGEMDLFIRLKNGNVYTAQVSAVTGDTDYAFETIEIVDPIGVNIPLAGVSTICPMLFCRLSSDRIEWNHRAVVGPAVLTALQEVPYFDSEGCS